MKFFNLLKILLKSSRDLNTARASDNRGDLTIIKNQVFVDGREIESPSTSNLSVTRKNGRVLVNGKEPKYKDS